MFGGIVDLGKQAILQYSVLLQPKNSISFLKICKDIQSMEVLQAAASKGMLIINIYSSYLESKS